MCQPIGDKDKDNMGTRKMKVNGTWTLEPDPRRMRQEVPKEPEHLKKEMKMALLAGTATPGGEGVTPWRGANPGSDQGANP